MLVSARRLSAASPERLEILIANVSSFAIKLVGIEKGLKFVQSFSQVAEVIIASTPEELARWKIAKDQANIGTFQASAQGASFSGCF